MSKKEQGKEQENVQVMETLQVMVEKNIKEYFSDFIFKKMINYGPDFVHNYFDGCSSEYVREALFEMEEKDLICQCFIDDFDLDYQFRYNLVTIFSTILMANVNLIETDSEEEN